MPEVSIVIPAYNASEYIADTLTSVINQRFQDWEAIVVNDCSSDNTREVVESMISQDDRIRIINLTQNMGAPAGPRNIGIKEAKGNWIAFLDADDIWHENKLEAQLRLLKATGAKFCSTQMSLFAKPEEMQLRDFDGQDFEWISFRKQLIKFRTPTSSVIAEKALLLQNPFNEDISYKAREDLDCWLRCHEQIGKSVKIRTKMMGYRLIEGQISGSKATMVKRHTHVLRNYVYRSGRKMTMIEALFFTLTHFSLAWFMRTVRGTI